MVEEFTVIYLGIKERKILQSLHIVRLIWTLRYLKVKHWILEKTWFIRRWLP